MGTGKKVVLPEIPAALNTSGLKTQHALARLQHHIASLYTHLLLNDNNSESMQLKFAYKPFGTVLHSVHLSTTPIVVFDHLNQQWAQAKKWSCQRFPRH